MTHTSTREYRRSRRPLRPSQTGGGFALTPVKIIVAITLLMVLVIGLVLLIWPYGRDTRTVVVANIADVSDKITDGVSHLIAQAFSDSAEAANPGDTVILEQLTGEVATPMIVHFLEVAPRKSCFGVGCSPARVEKDRMRTYTGPFTQSVSRALRPGVRARTPLLENLAALTRLPAYKSDDPHTPKVLIIATDLGQFTECSVYPPRPRPGSVNAGVRKAPAVPPLSTEACRRFMGELRGKFANTIVQVLLIARNEPFQTQELIEAWEQFFLANGASQVRIRILK